MWKRKLTITAGAFALASVPAILQATSLDTKRGTESVIIEHQAAQPQDQARPDQQAGSVNRAPDGTGFATFLTEQKSSQWLANSLIGKSIYSSDNNAIGDIENLVIDRDSGRVTAVVIGVGGFLGIGEKRVALPFSSVLTQKMKQGDVKLMVASNTENQLEKAPEFKTLKDQLAEERQRKALRKSDEQLIKQRSGEPRS